MSRQATFLKSVLNEANLYKRQQQLRHANTDQINEDNHCLHEK